MSAQIIGATYALAAANGPLQASPAALYPDVSNHTSGATPGLVPVTSGPNGSCGNYLCNAAESLSSGYNGPTGLGTPYGVTAFSTAAATSGSLSFAPTSEDLSAGVPSSAITVQLSPVTNSSLNLTVASTSSGGTFSSSPEGPFSAGPMTLNIAAGSGLSAPFYYEDTLAGSPILTASAPGSGEATLPTTVAAGALTEITVSPASATLAEGGSQVFTAAGSDQFGNPVSIDPSWATTVPGASLSPTSGSSSTLVTGDTTGTGYSVTATEGSVSGTAPVAVTAQPALSVTVTAGGLSGRRGNYQVPLTVTADNASNGTGVGQASVSLQIFASAQCSGAPEASGSGTTASNGRAGLTFTTRIAGTWCALATVTASGYTAASGQTSFNT